MPKGAATLVERIWVGKHHASGDHMFLTSNGWHRARTCRMLEPLKRADAKLAAEVRGAP